MTRRLAALVVALVLTLVSAPALAEPPDPTKDPIRLTVPTTVTDAEGHSLALPPGRFFAEPVFEKLDAETRRLQDQETRLTAENQVLRDAGGGMPSWWWVVGGVVAGAAAGFAATRL